MGQPRGICQIGAGEQIPELFFDAFPGGGGDALLTAGLLAGGIGLLAGLVSGGLGLFHGLFRGRGLGEGGQSGMLCGTADGAGSTGQEGGSHDAGLLIQEGPVQGLVPPLKVLRAGGEGDVGLLLPGQELFLTAKVLKLLEEVQEGGPLSFQLVPAGGEQLGFRACALQGCPLLLQPLQLPGEELRGLLQVGVVLPQSGKVLLLPAQIRGSFLQGVISGDLEPQGRDLLFQVLLPGRALLRQGQSVLCLSYQDILLLQGRFAPQDVVFRLLPGHGLGSAGGHAVGSFVQLLLLQQEPALGILVLPQEAFEYGHDFQHGQLSLPGLPGIGSKQRIFRPADAAQVLADAELGLLPLVPDLGGLGLQLVLELLIAARAEEVPEDLLPLGGACLEQLAEFALGDHGHLGELLPGDAQDVPDRLVHLPELADGTAVGEGQLRVGGLTGEAGAPGLGPVVFGIPADGVDLVVIGERQFHEGRGLRGCVLASEHAGFPAVAAGFAEEGEGDGIEDGGLAGAGVAGDQVQAAAAQVLQRKLLEPRIGAECGKSQFQRSHASPSQMLRISSRAKSRWVSLMGWLFWISYSSPKSSRGDRVFTSPASPTVWSSRVRVLS